MRRWSRLAVIRSCLTAGAAPQAWATPSTTYWTPCTIDFQPPGVTHFGIGTSFTVGRKGKSAESLPTDPILFEWGAKLDPKLRLEYGLDVVEPTDDPLFANAKVGYPEKTLSSGAPALELGFFNFGTKSGVTNQNIVYLQTGRSLPNGKTRVHAAYYVGNGSVLRSSTGEKESAGLMVALDRSRRAKWCWPPTTRAAGMPLVAGVCESTIATPQHQPPGRPGAVQ